MADEEAPECGWRLGLCAGCERCAFRHDFGTLDVRRLSAVVPVSAEQLIDAGIPLPPGMEYTPAPPVKVPLLHRLKWRIAEAIWGARRGVGFWIAGESPDDSEE